MDAHPADESADRYHISVLGGQGVYIGDHGIQVNLFTAEPPSGPVVAGNVPQAPPAFRPREDLMAVLRSGGSGAPVVRAVTGMRGVGKTQLAAAYARERIDAGSRLVAWVGAEDPTAILDGLAVVAARLGTDRPGVALEIVGTEVRNRLEADGDRCLIVFDNVTNLDDVRPYLPAGGHAEVVVTSTDTTTAGLGRPLAVDVFTASESVRFLAERTGIGDQQAAADLADELGHLPLALAQAAAVIASQRLTYPTYLERLRAYPTGKYLARAKGDPYPRGVAEAIGLSVDAATGADPTGLAGDLLEIISLLSPQGVARDLLHLGPSAGVLAAGADEALIDEAIGRLADASLLTFGGDETVAAHRMTMRAVRERAELGPNVLVPVAKACLLLDAARAALPEPRLHRGEVRIFAQHVAALTGHIASGAVYRSLGPAETQAVVVRMLHLRVWALSFLNMAGDAVTQAVALAEPLLADCEAALGPSHPGTLSMRNNLGYAYRAAGRLDDAIRQDERALADHERLSGSLHPETLTCLNNLGSAYDYAGRSAEAVEFLERAVAGRERVLGVDHRDTLSSRNNLAVAYSGAGRLSEALGGQQRTLSDRERVLGPDHPDTLRSRTNLAGDLKDAGRTQEAVLVYEQAAAGFARILGDEHQDTLLANSGLAACYRAMGRLAEAIALYEKTVDGLERELGPAHPVTVGVRAELDQARAYPITDSPAPAP